MSSINRWAAWIPAAVSGGVYGYALFRLMLALFGSAYGIGPFFHCLGWGVPAACPAGGSGAALAWAGLVAAATVVTCACGWAAAALTGDAAGAEEEEAEAWGYGGDALGDW